MYNIVWNVSFHLPEGYGFLARAENIHLYYELVNVTVVGDSHCVKLVLNVLLKTTSRYFVLHNIIALPARIYDNKFAQYLLDFPYFGLDNIQLFYILFTETELSHCSKGSIIVSVYPDRRPLQFVSKKIAPALKTPTLQRHGSVWVCRFPEQQHVTLPCWKNGAWTSRSEEPSGGGVLYNPSRCSVAASAFQTMPEVLGGTKAIPDAP